MLTQGEIESSYLLSLLKNKIKLEYASTRLIVEKSAL